jgi:excisionase family DNA binding protein
MDTVAELPTPARVYLGTRLLRAHEVATRLDVSVAAVYEAARHNRIGGLVRIGRRVRFDPEKFQAWIDAGGEALPGGWRHAC